MTEGGRRSGAAVVAVVSAELFAEFFSPEDAARLDRASRSLSQDRAARSLSEDRGADRDETRRPPSASPESAPGLVRVDRIADIPDPGAVRVLVTSWGVGPLDEDVLARFPRLELVAHTGATVKPFATDALFDRGVIVTQAGAGMARSVGEVSLAFTLALLHRIPALHEGVRTGGWYDPAAGTQHEIAEAPIAVIGASRTGRAYLEMIRALGARPLLVDPTVDAAEADALGAELLPLDAALQRARIVAVHAPTLPETHHLIGARELALMPDGAGLVNTARSWLVDERALQAEVSSGRLSAAIDVFDEEPLAAASPWRTLPNVLLTPHRAAGTREGRLRQGRIVADEIDAFVSGRELGHAVTRAHLATMG
ncbi:MULTISPECIES: hydroxyacid dehydrogenase [unclassified Microbacterium]|uniref:hydroxyacid dehydrogenase n=1 Tax=unclassified Microbacterium TaxID=2609290 RepID=UPI00301017D7